MHPKPALLAALVLLSGLPLVPASDLAPPPLPAPDALSPCQGVSGAEQNATHGEGDATLPTLAWAALKTGFRVVVAWETLAPTPGEVVYHVEGAADSARKVGLPASTRHVIVLEDPDMVVGGVLCFQARAGPLLSAWHAVRLANAYVRPPGETGAYTVNLLVHATEAHKDLDTIEAALSVFAQKVWDATDGNVRLGRVFFVAGDPQRQGAGYDRCRIQGPNDPLAFFRDPACDAIGTHSYDVFFTNDVNGANAWGSFLGIAFPDRHIWVRANGTVPGHGASGFPFTPDEVGFILAHEFGHYALDARDAYTGFGAGIVKCYDAATGVSLMGSDRRATELDEATVAPCPSGTVPSGYRESWEWMQDHYVDVADRAGGPVAGPSGTGGVFEVHAHRYVPDAP